MCVTYWKCVRVLNMYEAQLMGLKKYKKKQE